MEIDPPWTDLTSENSNYQNVDDGCVMLVEGSKDEREHVRTTQQMTQSVLVLRALVLRGRTIVHLHTLREERGKRKDTANASKSRQKIYIRLGGQRCQ